MTRQDLLKNIGAGTAVAVVILSGTLISSRPGQASDNAGNDDESEIQQGFVIAPVPLNLVGKDRALVGLGSYIVNAQVDCNGCHTSAPLSMPALEWIPGGVPYFGQRPTKVNPQYYLGGGQNFTLVPGFPDIISRNLTPDKTGLPEGGHTFEQFLQVMRTGMDFDHLHPNLPPPFDGSLLQIMPWPTFQNMSEHDLRAIYEYLSAIPCIAGPPAPDPLHNDCS
jgi:hypothetical protein